MMEKETKSQNSKIIVLGTVIVLVAVFLTGISYALFTLNVQGEKVHTLKSAKLELKFVNESEGIKLENTMPLTDEDGLKTASYQFTLKNTGDLASDYKLVLEDQAITGTRMPDHIIKYYLKKNTIENEPDLLNNLDNRILDQGVIRPNTNIIYELKLWMDYETGNEFQGTKFNVQIKAEGIQTVSATPSA